MPEYLLMVIQEADRFILTTESATWTWRPMVDDFKGLRASPPSGGTASVYCFNGYAGAAGLCRVTLVINPTNYEMDYWTPPEQIAAQVANTPTAATMLASATVGDTEQVVAVVDGRPWHTVRYADGTWQEAWYPLVLDTDPAPFSAVACAGVGTDLHLVANAGGHLWHTIRHDDGSWQRVWGDVFVPVPNPPGAFSVVTCAGVAGELHVAGLAGGAGPWHTIRHADGSWQSYWGDVPQVAGPIGGIADVSAAEVDGELRLAALIPGATAVMRQATRHPDGSWSAWSDPLELGPNAVQAIRCGKYVGQA